jgi:collagen type V/XI/XXIV/XXVII alpha
LDEQEQSFEPNFGPQDDQDMSLPDDGFQEPPSEDDFNAHHGDDPGMQSPPPFGEPQGPFEDNFGQADQDVAPADDEFRGSTFQETFDELNNPDMPGPEDQYQEPPANETFDSQAAQDFPPADDQYQAQSLEDSFDSNEGQGVLPQDLDEREFSPQGARFEDDKLPDFPAPQEQGYFGDARSSLHGMLEPEPEQQDYPFPQEPAQDVYYDPEEPMESEQQPPIDHYQGDHLPYQANEPMEMVGEDQGQEVFAAPGHIPSKGHGPHKGEKYQWLLPLMSAATLGWGMDALEEQYHAANLKASGFSFKGLAAKLFGSKKPKQDSNYTNPQGVSPADVGAEGDAAIPAEATADMHNPDGVAMAEQNGEWEDIDDNEPQDKKKGKRGLFGLLAIKKKQGDLEAQDQQPVDDQQFHDGQDPAMQAGEVYPDALTGEDGYRDDQNLANPSADPAAQQAKKKGLFAALFGSKKSRSQDPEGVDGNNLDQGMDPPIDETSYQDRDMNDEVGGHDDGMVSSDQMNSNGETDYQHDPNAKPKRKGLFARLFGKKSGFFARIFGSKERKQLNTEVHNTSGSLDDGNAADLNHDGVEEYPMESSSRMNDNTVPPDEHPETSAQVYGQKPKKRGIFAAFFGSKKKPKASDPAFNQDDPTQPPKKRGLFARARTVSEQNTAQRRAKRPGLFARLFGRKKAKNTDDIELGNMNQADEVRVGRVNTGSPELVQGEFETRQSTAADVMDDDHNGNFEDVPDKKHKKKKSKKHGMGLYRQASLAGKLDKDRKKKKGNRQSVMYDEEGNAVLVTEPQEAWKAPVKVRYAPIAPSAGMHQHVNAPRQRQRGAGRTAVAATNPGNWFWMDVYWK